MCVVVVIVVAVIFLGVIIPVVSVYVYKTTYFNPLILQIIGLMSEMLLYFVVFVISFCVRNARFLVNSPGIMPYIVILNV